MNSLMTDILLVSAMCAAASGILFLISRIGRKKIPPAFLYAAWTLLLIRMLIPSTLPAGFSVYRWVAPVQNQSRTDALTGIPAGPLKGIYAGGAAEPVTNDGQVSVPGQPADAGEMIENPQHEAPEANKSLPERVGLVLLNMLPVLYVVGADAVFLIYVITVVRMRMRIGRKSVRAAVSHEIRRISDRYGMPAPEQIIATDRVSVAAVYGIQKVLLINEDAYLKLPEEEREYIVLHELAHLKHRDGLWKTAALLACCFHWFNPTVWLAARQQRKAAEMCADAGVLKLIGEEKRRDYGMTLIHLAGKHHACYRQSPSLLSVEDSKENLKERIQAVCRYRRLTLAAGLCMAVLLAAAALFLLTGCPSSGTGSPAEPPAAGTEPADPSKESAERTESSETENAETENSETNASSEPTVPYTDPFAGKTLEETLALLSAETGTEGYPAYPQWSEFSLGNGCMAEAPAGWMETESGVVDPAKDFWQCDFPATCLSMYVDEMAAGEDGEEVLPYRHRNHTTEVSKPVTIDKAEFAWPSAVLDKIKEIQTLYLGIDGPYDTSETPKISNGITLVRVYYIVLEGGRLLEIRIPKAIYYTLSEEQDLWYTDRLLCDEDIDRVIGSLDLTGFLTGSAWKSYIMEGAFGELYALSSAMGSKERGAYGLEELEYENYVRLYDADTEGLTPVKFAPKAYGYAADYDPADVCSCLLMPLTGSKSDRIWQIVYNITTGAAVSVQPYENTLISGTPQQSPKIGPAMRPDQIADLPAGYYSRGSSYEVLYGEEHPEVDSINWLTVPDSASNPEKIVLYFDVYNKESASCSIIYTLAERTNGGWQMDRSFTQAVEDLKNTDWDAVAWTPAIH